MGWGRLQGALEAAGRHLLTLSCGARRKSYMFIIGMGAVCNGSSDVILCTRASMQVTFQAK